MNKNDITFSNQAHQLMVTVSRHFYLTAKGILTYQEKPNTVTLKNCRGSKKELLVYHVVIDRFSGNFIFQVVTTRQMFPLAEFLYHAWQSDKAEAHFWGLPDNLAIPKAISSPALFEGLKKVGVAPFNPTVGFSSGGHVIKALEEHLWSQILYRSTLHFKASIELHKANIYDSILGLSAHGDCRKIWQDNLHSGHPKKVPAYKAFVSAFSTEETSNDQLPLTLAKDSSSRAASIPPSAELPQYLTVPLQNLQFSEVLMEEANLINDQAWEEGGTIKGHKAAYRGLEHSPYCADALNYLSLYSKYDEEKCLLSKRAVLVGKAALGDLFIKKNTGHFWMILETRPYMRALLGLADCHRNQNEYAQALEIYREMLKLNPSDNQGVRYAIGDLLLLLDRRAELEQFFKEHGEEESCFMLYNQALYLFRTDSDNAQKILHKAIAANKHVCSYLSGEKYIPYHLPKHYSWGEPSEAICYAAEAKKTWEKSPGAFEWLKNNLLAFEKKVMVATTNITIEQLLQAFLAEQAMRLAKSTYNQYENVIEFFKTCIESYSYNYLNGEEKKLFDQHYSENSDQENLFCNLFGPEYVAESAVEFLSYFLPNKIICGKNLQKTSATVIKKLGRWLFNRGYINQDDFELMTEEAVKAAQELPAVDDFAEALFDYLAMSDLDDTEEEAEDLDDVFEVVAVKPGKIVLETYSAEGRIEIEVTVPQKLSILCKVGWLMNLFVVKTKNGWKIVEAGRIGY